MNGAYIDGLTMAMPIRGGGVLMETGTLALYNASRIYGNQATEAMNVYLKVAQMAMVLPAGPGYWVPNGKCTVLRKPCGSLNPNADTLVDCENNKDECAITADQSATDSTAITLNVANVGGGTGVQCETRTLNQPCNCAHTLPRTSTPAPSPRRLFF